MIITISGPPGSGKDTTAIHISERLNMPIISMGNLRREAAKEKGMTIEEFNAWSEENPVEGDHYFDEYQKRYGKENDHFIMVSRLGWHFIPHSKKVYIHVEPEEGARRIFEQKQISNERNEQIVKSVEEQIRLNKERMQCDIDRYSKLYSVNPYNPEQYDIVVDSTELTLQEKIEKVLELIESLKD